MWKWCPVGSFVLWETSGPINGTRFAITTSIRTPCYFNYYSSMPYAHTWPPTNCPNTVVSVHRWDEGCDPCNDGGSGNKKRGGWFDHSLYLSHNLKKIKLKNVRRQDIMWLKMKGRYLGIAKTGWGNGLLQAMVLKLLYFSYKKRRLLMNVINIYYVFYLFFIHYCYFYYVLPAHLSKTRNTVVTEKHLRFTSFLHSKHWVEWM